MVNDQTDSLCTLTNIIEEFNSAMEGNSNNSEQSNEQGNEPSKDTNADDISQKNLEPEPMEVENTEPENGKDDKEIKKGDDAETNTEENENEKNSLLSSLLLSENKKDNGTENANDKNEEKDKQENDDDDKNKDAADADIEKSKDEENDDADDEDFNPLLFCPDVSMEVDEAQVITNNESAPPEDFSDDLFTPAYSKYVDEMTGAEISFNLTPEECAIRAKTYGSHNPVQFMKVHCTACNVHLGSALAGQANRFVHPMLKVIICKECYHFYTSGEFEKDEDGSEMYCRWCGQGGQVLCCSKCEFVFCKKCIRNNFGRKKLTEVRDSEEWKCFRCNMDQLKELRAFCVEFFEYVRRETARAITLNDPEYMSRDFCICCQTQAKKRIGDDPKGSEAKRARRKKPEDPDYDPFATASQDDERITSPNNLINPPKSTIINRSPIRIIANAQQSVPGLIRYPTPTIRFGNTVLNVGQPRPQMNVAIRSPVVTQIKSSPSTISRPRVYSINPIRTPQPRPVLLTTPSNQVRPVTRTPNFLTQKTNIKHEWFDKTVRSAARVNSNLSYTLTQLNKTQATANSIETLAVVHNKLQEILSTSINSLIQIRKNLRTEFIAGIKSIKFPANTTTKKIGNDDDVILVNDTNTASTSKTKATVKTPPKKDLTPSVSLTKIASSGKSAKKSTDSNKSSPSSSGGYLKVKTFSQLQTVTSECITIPDDDMDDSAKKKDDKDDEDVIILEDPLADPLDISSDTEPSINNESTIVEGESDKHDKNPNTKNKDAKSDKESEKDEEEIEEIVINEIVIPKNDDAKHKSPKGESVTKDEHTEKKDDENKINADDKNKENEKDNSKVNEDKKNNESKEDSSKENKKDKNKEDTENKDPVSPKNVESQKDEESTSDKDKTVDKSETEETKIDETSDKKENETTDKKGDEKAENVDSTEPSTNGNDVDPAKNDASNENSNDSTANNSKTTKTVRKMIKVKVNTKNMDDLPKTIKTEPVETPAVKTSDGAEEKTKED